MKLELNLVVKNSLPAPIQEVKSLSA